MNLFQPPSRRLRVGNGACEQAALDFSMQLLLNEADYAMPGIRPAVARLANAMVAALGPELQLGSPLYNQCQAIIREMQVCILEAHPD